MATPAITFLQSRSIAAGATVFDAPSHPSKGLLRGYLVRVLATLVSSAASTAVTYIQWRDTILDTLFTNIQLFAPRYNNQLMSGNLSGRYWAELYEDNYGESLPILWNGLIVDQNNAPPVTNVASPLIVDFFIPFETPHLGPDRTWTCPPAHLFRGDVSLSITLPAALTVAIGGDTLTMTAASARWLAVTQAGDIGRLPVVQRFEVRTVSTDSVDIGRGFPLYVVDRRAPGTTVSYDIIVDGENINSGQVNGDDLSGMFRVVDEPGEVAPETRLRTFLRYVPVDSTPGDLEYAERSLSLKLYGASSGTFLLRLAERPSDAVKRSVAAALGVDPADCDSIPVTPRASPLGSIHRKVALNGPRSLAIKTGQGYSAPKGAANTVPTFPAGQHGLAVAGAALGAGKK